jgi:hypothetical protein
MKAKLCETGIYHLIGSKVETRRFQATGFRQLDSANTAPPYSLVPPCGAAAADAAVVFVNSPLADAVFLTAPPPPPPPPPAAAAPPPPPPPPPLPPPAAAPAALSNPSPARAGAVPRFPNALTPRPRPSEPAAATAARGTRAELRRSTDVM